jgi:hypothetical protein
MATRKIYDAVATTGTYKDKKTEEEKKRYATVGTVFENDKGQLSLKLDTIPIGPGWSGFIQFFEPRDNSQYPASNQARSSPAPSEHNAAKSNAYQPQPTQNLDEDSDDIPF